MIIDREYIVKDMARTNNTVIITFSIVMLVLLIILLVMTYNSKCKMDNYERFNSQDLLASDVYKRSNDMFNNAEIKPMAPMHDRANDGIQESDPLGNSSYAVADSTNENMYLTSQVPGSCKPLGAPPRDKLTSADLLPMDANSTFAELNPQCSGDLQDQNFLTAGYHIGVNTVGQSMRNANLQLRYEYPNPQIPVSPWMISTIEPDDKAHGLVDVGSPSNH